MELHVPLLRLPAELRLEVYEYLIPDFKLLRSSTGLDLKSLYSPPSDYSGLLYSCKHVQQELTHMLVQRTAILLQSLQKLLREEEHRDVVITIPQSLHQLRNLTVFTSRGKDLFELSREDPVYALFYLHCDTLTIKSHQPAGHEAIGLEPRNILRICLFLEKNGFSEYMPCFKRLVYDFSIPAKERNIIMCPKHAFVGKKQKWRWEFEKNLDEKVVSAVLERMPKKPSNGQTG
ncbi:hypothetical protein BDV95DRAFT_170962 [Massariosphaeria phaeospora]|uniref:F-box domain-containing protein n=1 Tax=Massariosphaeria phaeospora TaxID=100035 RepID=A0A7C8MEM7_9PLEO|nr:hypothetical protein BDV95DRAFT_170962 [Massariosphaeria phaeospora]